MILSNLFKKKEKKLEVLMYLNMNSRVEEIYIENGLGQKDLIQFALLLYARMFRIQRYSIDSQTEPIRLFEEMHEMSQKEDTLDFVNDNLNLMSIEVSNAKPFRIVFHDDELKTDSSIPTKSPNKYIYLVYSYVWQKLEEQNKKYLFLAFLTFSKMLKTEKLTQSASIRIPKMLSENTSKLFR